MTITSDTETRQTNDVVVSVRIPNGTDGDLTTEAERRLSRADGVVDVAVEGLRGLEPGLSATVVTVAVTVEFDRGADGVAMPEALGELTGVEMVGGPSN